MSIHMELELLRQSLTPFISRVWHRMIQTIWVNVNSALRNNLQPRSRKDPWHQTILLIQWRVRKLTWRLEVVSTRATLAPIMCKWINTPRLTKIRCQWLLSLNQSWLSHLRSNPIFNWTVAASQSVSLHSTFKESKLLQSRIFKSPAIQIRNRKKRTQLINRILHLRINRWSLSMWTECRYRATTMDTWTNRTTIQILRPTSIQWVRASYNSLSMGTVTSSVRSSRKWIRVSIIHLVLTTCIFK